MTLEELDRLAEHVKRLEQENKRYRIILANISKLHSQHALATDGTYGKKVRLLIDKFEFVELPV